MRKNKPYYFTIILLNLIKVAFFIFYLPLLLLIIHRLKTTLIINLDTISYTLTGILKVLKHVH
jgi:hypothetical protein